jgi:DNA primase
LVEGFLDLILPYQFGLRNLVASLGTALTPEQAKLLGRFARKVVVNYDGDRAGVQAAKRAIEILIAEDLEVKVLVLPDGADPDEFVRTRGASEYQKHRGDAQPHIQFVIDQAVKERNLNRPPEKDAAFEDLLPYIRAVRSPLQKREYFDLVMEELRVAPALRRAFWNSTKIGTHSGGSGRRTPIPTEDPTVTEEQLLRLLFADAQMRAVVLAKLTPTDYESLPTSTIFQAVVALDQEGKILDLESLNEKTNGDPVAARLVPMLLMSDPGGNESGSYDQRLLVAEGCIDGLRRLKIDRLIDSLRAEESAAARAGDIDKYNALQMEQIELTRRRNQLVNRAAARDTQPDH